MIESASRLPRRRRGLTSRAGLSVTLALSAMVLGVCGRGTAQEQPAAAQPSETSALAAAPTQPGWTNQRPPVIRTSKDGGSTRIMAAFDITQKSDEEVFPRSKTFAAAVSSLTGDSGVTGSSFESSGGSATFSFSTSRPTPFDEIETPRYVEIAAGYTRSYVDYTNAFMYLLDAGGTDGFGRQAAELRADLSVAGVSRVHSKSLSASRLDGHLLFGAHVMWFKSDTRDADLAQSYAKDVLGPVVGVREVFTLQLGNDQTLSIIGEAKYTLNAMTSGRVVYRPAGDPNPYPLYLDAISDIQSFRLGARYGKMGGNLSLEMSWQIDLVNSGGSVDSERVYQGFTAAGVFHF